MGITETRFIVFDIETTNPPENYKKHEIIEVGGLEIMGGKVNNKRTFHSLVRPPCQIQPHNYKVSGISDTMVKDAPTIDKVLPLFISFVGDAPLVAHNISFDAKVLNENLVVLGYNQLPNSLLCTFVLSKKIYPDEKSHGLDTVIEKLGIRVSSKGRHRAMGDVMATAEIFLRFLDILRQRGIVRLEDIGSLCSTDAKLEDFQQLKLF